MALLVKKLLDQNRIDDVKRASEDEKSRAELMKELGINWKIENRDVSLFQTPCNFGCCSGCYQEPPQVIAWALEKAQIKQTNRPGFRNRKLGRFLCCNVQEKQKISFTERTCKLSNRIVIIDRQKGINAIKGECTMKKYGCFCWARHLPPNCFWLSAWQAEVHQRVR